MDNLKHRYFDLLKSSWFEFFTLTVMMLYIAIFIICRATIIGIADSLIPYYWTIHVYSFLSLIPVIIYSPFKKIFDGYLDRNRLADGDAYFHPVIWFTIIMLGLGFAALPFLYAVNPILRHNPIWFTWYALPPLGMTILQSNTKFLSL